MFAGKINRKGKNRLGGNNMEKIQTKKQRLFLVDGDSEFRALLGAVLGAEDDFEVVGSAENGMEAIEKILTLKPDVVVTELILPEMDGLALIRTINDRLAANRPAIMILTAYSSPAVIREASALSTDYFALKPFPKAALFERIRSFRTARFFSWAQTEGVVRRELGLSTKELSAQALAWARAA
jgi:DNA-binding NarL/FixJ family response regulator